MLILEPIGDFIGSLFNIIWAILDVFVFGLIKLAFNIFIRISELDILSNTDLSGIYQRITMILTIVMVFYVTFEFVKYTVSPNVMTEKEKGVEGVVKRIIISILLIAFVPTIFSFGYKLQNRVIKSHVFSKVILGQEEINEKNIGGNFAADVFSAFLYVDYDACSPNCQKEEERVEKIMTAFKEDGVSGFAIVKATLFDIIDMNGGTEFQGLLAFIFGCFIVYILFLYCMDLGVRYAQLLFLQILSPIAIISYIAPKKDSMLQKWAKQSITTYLDLFIRISLMYFMILIIDILGKSLSPSEMTRNGDRAGIFVYLFMVIGLLIFAQRAPKLIKDLFPSSNAASIGFGSSSKERTEPLKKSLNTIKKPIAATTGAITGTARAIASLKAGDLTKGLKGFKRKNGNYVGAGLQRGLTGAYAITKAAAKGASAGAKDGKFKDAMAAGRQSVQKDEAVVNKGGTLLGHDFLGGRYQNEKVKLQVEIEALEEMTKLKKGVSTSIENIKFRKQMDSIGGAITASGDENAAKAWEGYKKKAEKAARMYADGKIDQTKFESEINNLVSEFNINYNKKVNISREDLELDSSKWGAVKTALEEAKEGAKTIAGTVYKDKDGKEHKIIYDENTFADKIGDITDNAETAVAQKKSTSEYKITQANASENNK